MWKLLGETVLKYRFLLLALLLLITAFMGWHASKVKLSYEFSRAIPTDNPKYRAYQEFRKKFGEDGNLMVIGIQTNKIFDAAIFNDYRRLHQSIKKVNGVNDVISLSSSINLTKNYETEKLQAVPVFNDGVLTQPQIDSSKDVLLGLPFYRGLLYNGQTDAWLMGVRIDQAILNSPQRNGVVTNIMGIANGFGAKHGIEMHLSGLPLIRTSLATRIEKETLWFTVISIALSAIILLIFFRSVRAMLLSLAVVIIGVICSFGTVDLMGYKITLLTALISPLVVVIGIPNCIYFLNKYHTTYKETGDKNKALVQMVAKMGVVTLFCNIAAAIGFAVFGLTKSAVLQEFGVVAGINIMALFFISLILIPAVLSMMGRPKEKHMRYLNNKRLLRWLSRLERWAMHHRKLIYTVTGVILVASAIGIFKLKSVGYIVDDLPKQTSYTPILNFLNNILKASCRLKLRWIPAKNMAYRAT